MVWIASVAMDLVPLPAERGDDPVDVDALRVGLERAVVIEDLHDAGGGAVARAASSQSSTVRRATTSQR